MTLADFVDRRSMLVEHHQEYLGWQLGWLAGLVDVSGVAADVLRSCFVYLKHPMDSVVAWSLLLRGTIEAARPAEVVYVGPGVAEEADPWHGNHMQFWPTLGDRPLADRLLPCVCSQLGVSFRRVTWPAPATTATASGPSPGWRARLREDLVIPYNFGRSATRRKKGDSALMLWTSGYGARMVAREESTHQRRVLVLDRHHAAPSLVQPLPLGCRPLSSPIDTTIPSPTPLSAELVTQARAIETRATVPGAGQVFEGRLATYISRICPVVERVAEQIQPLLSRESVVEVVATNPYSIIEFGCLVAAARAGTVRRTLVQHGDHAYPYDFWLATETQNFDHMACSDPTLPDDLTEAAERLGCTTPTFQLWAPRLDRMRKRKHAWARTGRVICYLPTHYLGDAVPIVGSGFEDGWYFRWQRALLGIMADHPELTFVWKALPPSSQGADDPLPSLLVDIPNVRYETGPFATIAPRIGGLVTDYLSTGLYEARSLGIPSLALSFSCFETIRPRARAMLGDTVHDCADIADADAAVRQFLIEARHSRR
jgi:hypothetical protein